MKNDKNIQEQIEEALNSIGGIKKATPKPYLLTRINGRLNRQPKSNWEKAAVFISRPYVMIVGLCLVIAINMGVILLTTSYANKTIAERPANTITDDDEYAVSFASIDNVENPEP
jgi:hypothetical protein